MQSRPLISLGSFDLIETIGRGGMGTVWRAEHREEGVPVAVKVVSAEHATDARYLEFFRREVHAVAGLSHPGIATVYDYGRIPVSGRDPQ